MMAKLLSCRACYPQREISVGVPWGAGETLVVLPLALWTHSILDSHMRIEMDSLC